MLRYQRAGAGQGGGAAAVPARGPEPEGPGPGRRITEMLEHRFPDDAGAIGRRYRRQDEVGTLAL